MTFYFPIRGSKADKSGYSIVVMYRLPKPVIRVRFPLPAIIKSPDEKTDISGKGI